MTFEQKFSTTLHLVLVSNKSELETPKGKLTFQCDLSGRKNDVTTGVSKNYLHCFPSLPFGADTLFKRSRIQKQSICLEISSQGSAI